MIGMPTPSPRLRALLLLAALVPIAARSGAAPSPQEKAPERRPAVEAVEGELVPAGLADDPAVWPHRESHRNSDPWLRENHDRIRKMRPRVLVLNFANDVDPDGIRDRTERFIRAISRATAYHGFDEPDARGFIEYEVARYIDLRDDPMPEGRRHENSSLFPLKPGRRGDVLCDYGRFYTEEFAELLGFEDPRKAGRYLNLHELVQAGAIHEMWFYAIHGEAWPGLETIELKQYYDDRCRPIPGRHGPAGNGHDSTMPWSGRSFRIAFFNPHRGIGCAMENFGHTLEWMARHGSIGYYRKYFDEFAELDLGRRHGLPLESLYDLRGEDAVTYPEKNVMEITRGGKRHRVDPYVAFGGNVHFPPGGRRHYDKGSPHTVLSVMESYRLRDGPDGKDRVREFHREQFARYESAVDDCMGSWVTYWAQCMPGLDSRAVDDEGRPMRNWWVFLFY